MYELDGIVYSGQPYVLPEIVAVNAVDDHVLEVTLSNGEHRQFDMKPYLDSGVFSSLKDELVFHAVQLEGGAPSWCGGLIDIAPETVINASRALVSA
ncbi:MAG: DUF2442 domain-containing protein [Propionibacteriaceae bacterium]|jgi:hypothetical protein|nr:DUF2442 domain-containing protein [Propionibacteriaceae bacterium]